VVWLNEYFSSVLRTANHSGKTAVCKKHANKVHGLVAIVRRTADTFGRDVGRHDPPENDF